MVNIRADGLVVGRGRERVAGPFEFALSAGEALVVTGPNGTGKSTLLRTLCGLLPPLGGKIRVEGLPACDGEPARALREVSHYVGHRSAMKPAMSVGGNLDFWRAYLRPGTTAGARAMTNGDALDAVGLPDLDDVPFGYLSAGQQRRACLARLLVAHRAVWILDEPTSALDSASQRRFAALMAAHVDGGGVVIAATHQPLGLETARQLVLDAFDRARAPSDGARAGVSHADIEADIRAAEGWL